MHYDLIRDSMFCTFYVYIETALSIVKHSPHAY